MMDKQCDSIINLLLMLGFYISNYAGTAKWRLGLSQANQDKLSLNLDPRTNLGETCMGTVSWRRRVAFVAGDKGIGLHRYKWVRER